MNLTKNKGFTIVEIMVVVSILGLLLVALTLFSFYRAGSLRQKIKDADAKRSQNPTAISEITLNKDILAFREELEARRVGLLDEPPLPSLFRVSQGISYDTVPEEAPRLARKLLGAALLRIRGGASEGEVLGLLKEASILGTMNPKILAEVASVALEANLVDFAREQADEVLKLDATYADAWLVKARLALKANHVTEAREALKTAADHKQKNAEIFLVYSELYLKEGKKEESEAALRQYHALMGGGH